MLVISYHEEILFILNMNDCSHQTRLIAESESTILPGSKRRVLGNYWIVQNCYSILQPKYSGEQDVGHTQTKISVLSTS